MACKFIIIFAISALAEAAIVPVAPAVPVLPARIEEYDAAPQYSFAYDVQDALTGDSKAQYETRNGDIVQGSYSFIEADGTRRIVDYTADPINGFNAIVSREPVLAAVAQAPIAPIGVSPVGIAPGVPTSPIGPASGPVPAIPVTGPDSDVEVLDARSGPIREATARRINGHVAGKPAQINRQPSTAIERKENLRAVPLRALASRLSAVPAAPVDQDIETNNVPVAAYTAAYSSPLAFSAPVSGLAYTPVKY